MTAKLVLFMTAAFAHHALTAFMKNQYAVEVEQVEACPDNEKTANPLRNLHFSRYNRTHKSLSYDFSYDRPLDEKVGGSMIVERWGDGGWIRMPFVDYQPNICKNVVRYFKDSWVNFYRAAGVPHPDKCPIPAGNYSIRNYMLDTSIFRMPFFSGRFRVTITFQDVNTKEIVQCIIYVVKITELF